MIRNCFLCALCIVFFLGCTSDQSKFDNFLKQAVEYIDQKEFDKANIQLQNALALSPDSVEVQKIFLNLYMAQKDSHKMFSTLIKLEKLDPEDMDTKLQIASLYMLSGEKGIPEAESRIAEVLKKEPANIKALSLKASLLILGKKPIEAITDVYEQILEIDPSHANSMIMLARINQQIGNPSQAKILLERVVANNPDDFSMYTELYVYYLTNREHKEAKKVLDKLVSKKPADPDPQILMGNFYAEQNQPKLAEEAYLKAISLSGDDVGTYILLAQFYEKTNQPEKAEKTITDAIKTHPEDLNLQLAYGHFLYKNKKLTKSLEVANAILDKKPSIQPAMKLKGRILLAQAQPGSASELFSALLNEEPDDAEYNYLMGAALMDMGKPDLALAYFSKALKKDPKYFEARFLTAELHYRRRNFSLAEDQVKKALELVPQNRLALLLQAKIEAALGKTESATTMYEDLIKTDPDSPATYFNLGNLYLGQKDLASARKNYEKALDCNPNLMDVFTSLIGTYIMENKFQEGLERCASQLKKAKDHPAITSIIHNQEGNLYMGLEDAENAKKAYELSLKENPRYILPYLSLNRIYMAQGDMEQAIKILETLTRERPDQAGGFTTLASLYETQGKMDLAEQNYIKALAINPSQVQALNNLAFLYANQNREMNKALEYARKAREIAGEIPTIMDTLGWVYYRKNLVDAAIQEFDSCIQKNPKNPLFHYHKGLALQAKGDAEEAKKSLQAALDLGKDFAEKADAEKRLSEL